MAVRGMAGGGVRRSDPKRATTWRRAGGTMMLKMLADGGELRDGWLCSGRHRAALDSVARTSAVVTRFYGGTRDGQHRSAWPIRARHVDA
jgi:hypothetical protein